MANDLHGQDLAARIVRARIARELFGVDAQPVRLSRFELRGELGRGAMGCVYAAYDPVRGHEVALKTLLDISPAGIYRLKTEFRSLAELSHPNLVALYELFNEEDDWFFTMERIEGVSFLDYVRPNVGNRRVLDADRLRAALGQLIAGVRAIHAAGKLHCDLKPSNVLVTEQGRIVIMDFGLVSEQAIGGPGRTLDACTAGTPDYMAPELLEGAAPSRAGDFYAIGVMLYQALVSELPFPGSVLEQIRRKRCEAARAPSELCSEIPTDLSELCCRLLARSPSERPSDDELAALAWTPRPPPTVAEPPFVGRVQELACLTEALRRTGSGGAVTALVSGVSGIGKTALLRRFVSGLPDTTLVLSGRCYAKESLPYKAFDEIVDALSRHLRKLTEPERGALLPPNAGALARLFPVLGRAGVLGTAAVAGAPINQVELRRRGVAALKELLRRLASQRSLVIVIDDLQWGDRDSARVLDELLVEPDAPPALFLLGYRHDELQSSECLRHLDVLNAPASDRRLALELMPLDAASSLALARSLVGEGEHLAGAVAREAEGHPMFLTWLATHHRGGGAEAVPEGPPPTLESVVLHQLENVSEHAAALLRVLVVARHPLERAVAEYAAGLDDGAAGALDALCGARLARLHGPGRLDRLEVYHDRIRELLWARLSETQRAACHGAIARALERCSIADAERLAEHLYAAGALDEAYVQTCLAAEAAQRKLAFNRAVELYRQAIACREQAREAPDPNLLRQLGDALVNAGRGAEAAAAYLQAAPLVAAEHGRLLRRDAALQLFFSGRNDEGLAVIRELFAELGLSLPGPVSSALWMARGLLSHALAREGVRSAPRLLRTGPRTEQGSIAGSLAVGFMAADMFAGVALASRVLSAPAGSYEPEAELSALLSVALGMSLASHMRVTTDGLVRRAHRLAEQVGTPWARGVALLSEAIAHHFRCSYRLAAESAGRSMALFRDECVGASFYVSVAAAIRYAALEQFGDIAEIARDAPQAMRSARERGDRYAGMTLAIVAAFGHLMKDEPELAIGVLESAASREGQYGEMQRLLGFRLTEAQLYAGMCRQAFAQADRARGEFRRSREYYLPYFRMAGSFIHGNAALAAYQDEADPHLLELALRDARTLLGTRMAIAPAAARQLRAAVAFQRGDVELACKLLRRAEQIYELCDGGMYALYARRARGLITRGEIGVRLRAETETALQAQGIRDVARWTRTKLPGFALTGT